MSEKTIRYSISSFAILLVLGHLFVPTLKVDSITVALLVISVVPWLGPLFKSLEFPGLGKVEFRDLENAENQAKKVGLLHSESDGNVEYSFEKVFSEDPNLALAGLRIELEKKLQSIAENNNIKVHRKSIRTLLSVLRENRLLSSEQVKVLSDMISLLNAAVHGANLKNNSVEWVMDVGPRLLSNLDRIVQDKK